MASNKFTVLSGRLVMLNRSSTGNYIFRFINFITFIDLSIRRKFFLFAVGVLFWFVAMFAVNITALYDLQSKTDAIIKRVIPQERTTLAIVRELQAIIIETGDLVSVSTPADIMKKTESSSQRLHKIQDMIASLKVNSSGNWDGVDQGRMTGFFFKVAVAGDSEMGKYLDEVAAVNSLAEKQLDLLVI